MVPNFWFSESVHKPVNRVSGVSKLPSFGEGNIFVVKKVSLTMLPMVLGV